MERSERMKNLHEQHGSQINWIEISRTPNLSEDFIRDFKDQVDWKLISQYQTLSEDFIREFADQLEWSQICQHQTLSEDFIKNLPEGLEINISISDPEILSEG